jgi:hypothetical protein
MGKYSIIASASDGENTVFSAVALDVLSTEALRPVISGGREQNIRLGESIVLDASLSCDLDYLDCGYSGMSFAWSCLQIHPVVSDRCDITLQTYNTSNAKLLVFAASITTSEITVVVSKALSNGAVVSRAASVTLSVIEPAFPLVTLYTLNSRPNEDDEVRITSSVNLRDGCVLDWNVMTSSSGLLDVSAISLTPMSYNMTTEQSNSQVTIDFVLPPFVLMDGLEYVVSLSGTIAGVSKASSIAITVNDNPRPGWLRVSPSDGTELLTLYDVAARAWDDSDLPLRYTFLISTGSKNLVLSKNTLRSSLSTILPAGVDSNQYELVIIGEIMDILGGKSSASTSCTVFPLSNESFVFGQASEGRRRLLNDSYSFELKDITIAAAVANAASCIYAPNCTLLNRDQCYAIENTCGACLSGYYDEYDNLDGNTTCYKEDLHECSASNTGASFCLTDQDCGRWQVCNGINQCIHSLKSCPFNCSGRGECLFLSYENSTDYGDQCNQGDFSCYPSCKCNAGFSGRGCTYSDVQLADAKSVRSMLASYFRDLIGESDIDRQTISIYVQLLYALVFRSDEIDEISAGILLDICSVLLESAVESRTRIESVNNILPVIDIAFKAVGIAARNEEYLFHILSKYIRLWELVTSAFEFPVERALSLFSMRLGSKLHIQRNVYNADGVLGSNISVPLPSTLGQCLSNSNTRHSNLELSADILSDSDRISVVSLEEGKLFKETTDKFEYNTKSMIVVFPLINASLRNPFFDVELKNNHVYELYNVSLYENRSLEVSTICTLEVRHVEVLCPHTNITVEHFCDGIPGIITTSCPNIFDVRSVQCSALDSNIFASCEMVSFNQKTTTCRCHVLQESAQQHRVFYVAGGSVSKRLTGSNYTSFTKNIVANSTLGFSPSFFILGVLFAYILWLATIFIRDQCISRDNHSGKNVECTYTLNDCNGDKSTTEKLVSKSLYDRFTSNSKSSLIPFIKAHRLLSPILTHSHRTAIPELTFSISTAMFIITVICNIIDGGDRFCHDIISRDECLGASFRLSTHEWRRCRWEEADQKCSSEQIIDSPVALLLIVAITSTLTSLFNALLTWLYRVSTAEVVPYVSDSLRLESESDQSSIEEIIKAMSCKIMLRRQDWRDGVDSLVAFDAAWGIVPFEDNELLEGAYPYKISDAAILTIRSLLNQVRETKQRSVRAVLCNESRGHVARRERLSKAAFLDLKVIQCLFLDSLPYYSRRLLCSVLDFEHPEDIFVPDRFIPSLAWAFIAIFVLLSMLYVVYFAVVTEEVIQIAWVSTFAGWLLFDSLVIRPMLIYMVIYWCPRFTYPSVKSAFQKLVSSIVSIESTSIFTEARHDQLLSVSRGSLGAPLYSSAALVAALRNLSPLSSKAISLVNLLVSDLPPVPLVLPRSETAAFERIWRFWLDLVYFYNPIVACFAFTPQPLGALILELGLIAYCSTVVYVVYTAVTSNLQLYLDWLPLAAVLVSIALWFCICTFVLPPKEGYENSSVLDSDSHDRVDSVSAEFGSTANTHDIVNVYQEQSASALPSDMRPGICSELTPGALVVYGRDHSDAGFNV